jgi:hypothetical protein
LLRFLFAKLIANFFSFMARASKYCIFCGDHPTTREHIWAKWLGQFIPKTMRNYSSGSSILNADSVEHTSKIWGGDPCGRQLQIVCKRCNERWMSDLQKTAKPILIPLLRGTDISLNGQRQRTLAAWAAMSVICAEYFYPHRTAVSVTDRRWLFNTKTAPNDFRIWIGNYERKEWKPHWVHTSLRITEHALEHRWAIQPDGTPRANTQTTAFVVGRLFIHAFSCPFPEILHANEIAAGVDAKLYRVDF